VRFVKTGKQRDDDSLLLLPFVRRAAAADDADLHRLVVPRLPQGFRHGIVVVTG
jgi:hypothetical protein